MRARVSASAGVTMYARVVYDDSSDRISRALAFSRDYGETFTPGDTTGFPGESDRAIGVSIYQDFVQ